MKALTTTEQEQLKKQYSEYTKVIYLSSTLNIPG